MEDLDREYEEMANEGSADVSFSGSFAIQTPPEIVSQQSTPREDFTPTIPVTSMIGDEYYEKSWCDRSLEQLEMTIQLLDQCLDNDIKDLNKQKSTVMQCRKQFDEIKQTVYGG